MIKAFSVETSLQDYKEALDAVEYPHIDDHELENLMSGFSKRVACIDYVISNNLKTGLKSRRYLISSTK